MNKKLAVKDFDLRSMKLNSKNQLSVDFFDLNEKNDLLSVDSDSVPHEDLINSLNELKIVFADYLGILKGWDFARENNRNNEEKLKEAITSYNDEINRCKVAGVTITDKGIKISGSLVCENGAVSINTNVIKFENEDSDIGLTAKSIVDELKIEAWKFIFQGKRAKDLFTDSQDESGLGNSTEKQMSVA